MKKILSYRRYPNFYKGLSEKMAELITTDSGLQYQDIQVGTGESAGSGKTASVHYTGWLLDGTKFDSSLDRGQPLELSLIHI